MLLWYLTVRHRGVVSRHRETVSSLLVPPDPIGICSLLPPVSCFSLSCLQSALLWQNHAHTGSWNRSVSYHGPSVVSFKELHFHLDHALEPDLGALVSVSCTAAGHWFILLPFELLEECRQVRSHVRECKLGTVCPEEAQQCLHAKLLGQPLWLASPTADSALPDNCASSLGPQRYRSCFSVPSTYCRARLAYEKYGSASPSHPGIREDRSPASLVVYFRESCSFSKRAAVRSAIYYP